MTAQVFLCSRYANAMLKSLTGLVFNFSFFLFLQDHNYCCAASCLVSITFLSKISLDLCMSWEI